MCIRRGVDELRCDPDLAALSLDTAFKYVSNVEVAANLSSVDRLAFVHSCRVARDDIEIPETGEVSNDVFGETISKPCCHFIPAYVVERQHGDRRFTPGRSWPRPEQRHHTASGNQQQDRYHRNRSLLPASTFQPSESEWQHGCRVSRNAINSHGLSDVLDLELTQRFQTQREL